MGRLIFCAARLRSGIAQVQAVRPVGPFRAATGRIHLTCLVSSLFPVTALMLILWPSSREIGPSTSWPCGSLYFYLDRFELCLLGFWQSDIHHAVLELGFDLCLIRIVRHLETPNEGTV